MGRSEAEDAGGLTPVKDDNEAAAHFTRRTLLFFNCFDYIFQDPEAAPQEAEPAPPEETETKDNAQSAPYAVLSVVGCAGGIVSLAVAGMWGAEKLKERKSCP